MRSRAHFRSHPLHPALIPFPFAFLTGAFVFDVLGTLTGAASLCATAGHLVVGGVATGVLAAVPGVIDYLHSVPPASSAKRRATRHAILNVLALTLFAAGFIGRGPDSTPSWLTLALELAGTGALGYAGWLGGTLVTRNLISVDHRHAGSGKWREDRLTARGSDPLVVGHVDDLKADQMKLLLVNDRRLDVQCLWHGTQFSVKAGAAKCGPATEPIRVFPVHQRADGQLTIDAPAG